MIVVPTAKNGPVFAVDGNAKGTVEEESPALLWSLPDNTPDVPSPLIHEGLVYLCRENGNLMCLDAKTGQLHYQELTHRTRHRASPVFADGKIYLNARDGKISVVKAGPKFEMLAQNDLGEEISASPAISNGTIYLRTFDALWAIRK
jgi:outer membrane protein assembly factor BamB